MAVKVGLWGQVGSLLTVCQQLAFQEARSKAASGSGMLKEG